MSRLQRMIKHQITETTQFVANTWAGGHKPVPTKMINDYMDAIEFADWPEDATAHNKFDASVKREGLKDIQSFIKKATRELQFALANTTLQSNKFWGQVAHDLWLTRNGHGAGFWDDPKFYGGQKNADALSKAAESMGGKDLYVADNGKVYVS